MNYKTFKNYILVSILFFTISSVSAQESNRWEINKHGGITWQVEDRLSHHDHIEMSGKRISAVVNYGVEADSSFYVKRNVVWPMLRTIPNNTHASLMHEFSDNIIPMIKLDGNFIQEKV